jgi:hypothetical protein
MLANYRFGSFHLGVTNLLTIPDAASMVPNQVIENGVLA